LVQGLSFTAPLFLSLVYCYGSLCFIVQAAYDRIMELRIATPQVILNYAAFLQVRVRACVSLFGVELRAAF